MGTFPTQAEQEPAHTLHTAAGSAATLVISRIFPYHKLQFQFLGLLMPRLFSLRALFQVSAQEGGVPALC